MRENIFIFLKHLFSHELIFEDNPNYTQKEKAVNKYLTTPVHDTYLNTYHVQNSVARLFLVFC